ncbi:hypothetical protein HW49_07410 [Porphyromonadaceae bacterium COT-184 OH4590]|nr:hypothetical protein HW49_07410 [Porphyromonadaceae bacterium COT-184 OH4590]
MKKGLLVLTTIILATIMFSSCKQEEKPLTLKDLAGYTFEGDDIKDDKSKVTYTLVFDKSEQKFTFSSTLPFTSNGTYTISGTTVVLNYEGGAKEVLQSDGPKKLIYKLKTKDIILKRK